MIEILKSMGITAIMIIAGFATCITIVGGFILLYKTAGETGFLIMMGLFAFAGMTWMTYHFRNN